jgi:hypothetical protein
MSTRAQIELTNEEDRVLLYHHFDGYPEWLVPNLIQKALIIMQDDAVDPAYKQMCYRPEAAALYFAEAHFQNVKEFNRKYKEKGWKIPLCSGFEFCDNHGLHADIEWFYLVHLAKEPDGWLTEVLRPKKAYWEAKKLPKYISEAEDLLEKKGELFIARERIEYLGKFPRPGEVYRRRWYDLGGKEVTEYIEVLEAKDWFVRAKLIRKRAGKKEFEGEVEITPFDLRHYSIRIRRT